MLTTPTQRKDIAKKWLVVSGAKSLVSPSSVPLSHKPTFPLQPNTISSLSIPIPVVGLDYLVALNLVFLPIIA
jgi:hypothetical protein